MARCSRARWSQPDTVSRPCATMVPGRTAPVVARPETSTCELRVGIDDSSRWRRRPGPAAPGAVGQPPFRASGGTPARDRAARHDDVLGTFHATPRPADRPAEMIPTLSLAVSSPLRGPRIDDLAALMRACRSGPDIAGTRTVRMPTSRFRGGATAASRRTEPADVQRIPRAAARRVVLAGLLFGVVLPRWRELVRGSRRRGCDGRAARGGRRSSRRGRRPPGSSEGVLRPVSRLLVGASAAPGSDVPWLSRRGDGRGGRHGRRPPVARRAARRGGVVVSARRRLPVVRARQRGELAVAAPAAGGGEPARPACPVGCLPRRWWRRRGVGVGGAPAPVAGAPIAVVRVGRPFRLGACLGRARRRARVPSAERRPRPARGGGRRGRALGGRDIPGRPQPAARRSPARAVRSRRVRVPDGLHRPSMLDGAHSCSGGCAPWGRR